VQDQPIAGALAGLASRSTDLALEVEPISSQEELISARKVSMHSKVRLALENPG